MAEQTTLKTYGYLTNPEGAVMVLLELFGDLRVRARNQAVEELHNGHLARVVGGGGYVSRKCWDSV